MLAGKDSVEGVCVCVCVCVCVYGEGASMHEDGRTGCESRVNKNKKCTHGRQLLGSYQVGSWPVIDSVSEP